MASNLYLASAWDKVCFPSIYLSSCNQTFNIGLYFQAIQDNIKYFYDLEILLKTVEYGIAEKLVTKQNWGVWKFWGPVLDSSIKNSS